MWYLQFHQGLDELRKVGLCLADFSLKRKCFVYLVCVIPHFVKAKLARCLQFMMEMKSVFHYLIHYSISLSLLEDVATLSVC